MNVLQRLIATLKRWLRKIFSPGRPKPSRDAQCRELRQIVYQAAALAQRNSEVADAERLNQLVVTADRLDIYARMLESVLFSDRRLQQLQLRFARMYRDTAKASRALVTAVNQQNFSAGEAAVSALENATQLEKELVESMEALCRSKRSRKRNYSNSHSS